MYSIAYLDHGLRPSEAKGGEVALWKEKSREKDTYRYALVR